MRMFLSLMKHETENCLEQVNHGLTDSKDYFLDPDGVNRGHVPIKVHCSWLLQLARIHGAKLSQK